MCGGTENQFMTLARMLDRVRFDVEFACLRRWGGFVDELVARNIPLTDYPVSTFCSLAALAQQARLTRHIRRRRIQIVHAYNFYGNVFATPPARLVAPVVIASIRDRAPYLTRMQKRVQRYACQFADCILVNADAVKEWLIADGYDASKIAVIRNGVDLTRFDDLPPQVNLRRELGLPDDTPLVGVVSRLTRLKGLEHFSKPRRSFARRCRRFAFWSSVKPARWTVTTFESCRNTRFGAASPSTSSSREFEPTCPRCSPALRCRSCRRSTRRSRTWSSSRCGRSADGGDACRRNARGRG
jgi:hypothetical protein